MQAKIQIPDKTIPAVFSLDILASQLHAAVRDLGLEFDSDLIARTLLKSSWRPCALSYLLDIQVALIFVLIIAVRKLCQIAEIIS